MWLEMGAALVWQSAQPPTPTPAAVRDVFQQLYQRMIAAVPGTLTGAVVFAVFLFLAWLGARTIAYTAPRVRADTSVVLLLARAYYYSVLIFGLLTALSTAGLNVNPLIAGLGLTGFALSFALKDVLSNLLSGIMLLLYRPFRLGDQIKMGEYEGTIKTIRMRDTVVRGYDGRLIIIPNTKLITEVVVNNSTAKLVRETVTIDVAPQSDLEVAREIFVRAMTEHAALEGRAEPRVAVKTQTDHAVELEGRYWCNPRTFDRAAIKQDVAQAVVHALTQAGITANAPPQAPLPLVQAHVAPAEDEAAAPDPVLAAIAEPHGDRQLSAKADTTQ